MRGTSYHDYVMAVDRVEKRLLRVTAALDAAGVKYAVIGGNAVAAWVARVDPTATRATKDVDLLIDQADVERVAQVMGELGFAREDLRRMIMFTDPDEPSRRSGVHFVLAETLIRPSYVCSAPSLKESVRDPRGFQVVDLAALVRMKLTSNRDIDRAHVRDLLGLDLIDESVRRKLPPELKARLADIEAKPED